MKNFLLKFPFIYRTYQKTVRIKKNEYLFFQYLFKNIRSKKLRVLDLCCGDSFILNFINEYIEDYLGLDNNNLYLKKSLIKWKKYKFINEDLNNVALNYLEGLCILNSIYYLGSGTCITLNKLVFPGIPIGIPATTTT